jgi:hypothetical protein
MRPGGLEPPTFWSVARRSIRLSYGRNTKDDAHDRTRTCTPFPALVPQTSLSTNSSTWAEYQPLPFGTTVRLRGAAGQCSRRDSNPHGVNPHRVLNPARLPIPPPERMLQLHVHGAGGNRTPDLLNAIQALSQLSYGPFARPARPGTRLGRLTSIFQSTTALTCSSSGADETRTRDLRCDRPAL